MMDVGTSLGYDPARMATSKRPGCEHCEPIDLEQAAGILGVRVSYANKIAGQPDRFPPAAGVLGKTRWWWRHEVEAFRDQRTPGR